MVSSPLQPRAVEGLLPQPVTSGFPHLVGLVVRTKPIYGFSDVSSSLASPSSSRGVSLLLKEGLMEGVLPARSSFSSSHPASPASTLLPLVTDFE